MSPPEILPPHSEWLEPDGLGGFASGTSLGFRTRRYHALLLAALEPPASRFALVQSVSLRLVTPQGSLDLWPEVYAGGVTTGLDPAEREFTNDPWPTFRRETPFGSVAVVELFVPHERPAVALSVRLEQRVEGARLELRPLLSGRDFHALHRENAGVRWEAELRGRVVRWAPYPGVPAIQCLSNGEYHADPDWYRNFHYADEAARGLDAREDLASPGIFRFDLSRGEAVCLFSAELAAGLRFEGADPERLVEVLRHSELERRGRFAGPLEHAADAYLVRRGAGHTIVAGYPWFGDWGRDSFIAIRGLCFAQGELETARHILCTWADAVSDGMLPNRFSDHAGDQPEYNSVDASLWFVLAVHELIERDRLAGVLNDTDKRRLEEALFAIVEGYARGTRHGIRRDADGLLAAGAPGVQLTWMDAKVGDFVVTPRIGKPVEVQALWIHALLAAAERQPRYRAWAEAARAAFERRFWNPERQMLFDVVDVDHQAGQTDPACRPNQIFAAGGLPHTLLDAGRARLVIDAVERELWTPLGLRSLERGHPAYRGSYTGGVLERDGAYHQGTVWPWLLGAFVEAWVKSRGGGVAAKREARNRFVLPLLHHVEQVGLDHVSEIADGDEPFTARGCPFQAWSVGELLRLEREILV